MQCIYDLVPIPACLLLNLLFNFKDPSVINVCSFECRICTVLSKVDPSKIRSSVTIDGYNDGCDHIYYNLLVAQHGKDQSIPKLLIGDILWNAERDPCTSSEPCHCSMLCKDSVENESIFGPEDYDQHHTQDFYRVALKKTPTHIYTHKIVKSCLFCVKTGQ